jgi:hypothetical protein
MQMNDKKRDVSSYPAFPYYENDINLYVPVGLNSVHWPTVTDNNLKTKPENTGNRKPVAGSRISFLHPGGFFPVLTWCHPGLALENGIEGSFRIKTGIKGYSKYRKIIVFGIIES